ncbi:MAG: efflux RND transporter periplasmic adaptor subunit [Pirellulales bacterium]|nr:efflux RND transporter periplasmic adaptor subunit [Pirellulales bacterium]
MLRHNTRAVRRAAWSLAAMAATLGCSRANEYVAPPPAVVTVAQPVEREIVRQLEFTGTTRSIKAVDVRARVAGYLQRIAFQDGAEVKAGDLLFVIEPAPFEAALDLAKAAVQKANAALALSQADLARTEPLVQRGALTAQELDVKRADVATAQADVASAKAALRKAELDLAYTQVQSPITGRVSRHLVDVGNLVQPGETVLTRVEAYDPIHVYFSVSESDVLEFMKVNQATAMQKIRDDPPKLYAGLSGEEGFPHEGRLDFAEIGVDPNTGTQSRRGEFPNPDGKLVPGLFARVRLPIGSAEPGLMVPDRAIATDQRGEYVLVVDEKNIVEHRPVELGMRIAGMRVVESGLQGNEWIVVNGLQRARPGAEVKPERTKEIAETKDLIGINDPALATDATEEPQIEAAQGTQPAENATGGN